MINQPLEAIYALYRFKNSSNKKDILLYLVMWYGYWDMTWDPLEDADEHTRTLMEEACAAEGYQSMDDLPAKQEVFCPADHVVTTSERSQRFFLEHGIPLPEDANRTYQPQA
ncbi:hypothetical protein BD626DRAFT_414150 [Schizophyllum amplum]|uniref:Chromo domain-containing protein n=1 Tax=Schizophyllum amplum TaxID=97359 RepID=A0A550BUW7_9AGAR|nr:hypothetical protein BD626DRAFT_414150 [Auriculariopsis ampla]